MSPNSSGAVSLVASLLRYCRAVRWLLVLLPTASTLFLLPTSLFAYSCLIGVSPLPPALFPVLAPHSVRAPLLWVVQRRRLLTARFFVVALPLYPPALLRCSSRGPRVFLLPALLGAIFSRLFHGAFFTLPPAGVMLDFAFRIPWAIRLLLGSSVPLPSTFTARFHSNTFDPGRSV